MIGYIIMASGNSSRFGSNKLMQEYLEKPLIAHCMGLLEPYAHKVVVTRQPDVAQYCHTHHFPVILHDAPHRNDTIKIGLDYVIGDSHQCTENTHLFTETSQICTGHKFTGFMFLVADQPLLSSASIQALEAAFLEDPSRIYRLSYGEIPGNPVLFPGEMLEELRNLPEKSGGSYLLKKYPERTTLIQAQSKAELFDVDTQEDYQKLMHW